MRLCAQGLPGCRYRTANSHVDKMARYHARAVQPMVLLGVLLPVSAGATTCLHGGVCIDVPRVSLSGFAAALTVTLPALQPTGTPWPAMCRVLVLERHADANATLEYNTTVALYGNVTNGYSLADLQLSAQPPHSGHFVFEVSLLADTSGVSSQLWHGGTGGELTLYSIPPFLSLLPPILTVVMAVATRQVLFALLMGVYLGSLLVYRFNPLVGALRMLDTMLPNAIGGGGHPLLLVFTLLLGGMISVVRQSGGAAGLAQVATGFATRPSQVRMVSGGSVEATWRLRDATLLPCYPATLLPCYSRRCYSRPQGSRRWWASTIMPRSSSPAPPCSPSPSPSVSRL